MQSFQIILHVKGSYRYGYLAIGHVYQVTILIAAASQRTEAQFAYSSRLYVAIDHLLLDFPVECPSLLPAAVSWLTPPQDVLKL